MRSLAVAVASGWFWLTFYGLGPLTSSADLATAGLWLAGGCLIAAICGVAGALRRLGRPAPQGPGPPRGGRSPGT